MVVVLLLHCARHCPEIVVFDIMLFTLIRVRHHSDYVDTACVTLIILYIDVIQQTFKSQAALQVI